MDIRGGGFYIQCNALNDRYASPIKYHTIISFNSNVQEWRKFNFKIKPSIFPKNTKYINLMFKWYGGGVEGGGLKCTPKLEPPGVLEFS